MKKFLVTTLAISTGLISSLFFWPTVSPVLAPNKAKLQSQLPPKTSDYFQNVLAAETYAPLPQAYAAVQGTNANLIKTSSFETAASGQPTNWVYLLGSTKNNTFLSQEGIRSGSHGLKFTGGETGQFGITQTTTKTTPGRTYTLSVYVKVVNAPSITLRLGLWDEQNNKEGDIKDFTFSNTQDWTRISLTTTTPGIITDPKNQFPIFEILGLTHGNVYIDDFQLEEGDELSPYNSAQAKDSTFAGIGDGSLTFSPFGAIYPTVNGMGTIGSSSNKFESLNLTNASINSAGELSVTGASIQGNLSVSGDLALDGDLTFPTINPNSLVYAGSNSELLGIASGTSGYILQSNGPNAAPSWVAASGVSGGNANQLQGFTWEAAGTIGSTTPNTGAFTTLRATSNVTFGGLTTNGGLLYTNGSGVIGQTAAGTSGQILISNGGGSPSWTDAGTAGLNYWQRANGLLAPLNITDDLAVGGTATTTAKFQVFSTTGNATSAGNLTFTSASSVQTTSNQTLTIGGSSTGNLSLMPRNGSGFTGINTASPVHTLEVNGDGVFSGAKTTNSGTGVFLSYGDTANTGNISSVTWGSTYRDMQISAANLIFRAGTGTVSERARFTPTGLFGIGTTNPLASFDLRPSSGTLATASISGATSFAGLVVDNSGAGDLFTASSSGLNRFVITQNGNVGIGTTLPAQALDVTGFGRFSSGIQINGGTTVIDSSRNLVNLGGTVRAGSGNALSLQTNASSTTYLHITTGGNIGIGPANTSPLTTLDIRANSGTTAIASVSGATSFAGLLTDNSGVGDLFTASKSGATKFVIANSGKVGINSAIPANLLDITAQNINGSGMTFYTPNRTKSLSISYDTSNITYSATGQDVIYNSSLFINNVAVYGAGRLGVGGTGGGTLPTDSTVNFRPYTSFGGTVSVASISGSTSFASLLVDNSGTGDLFTASSSGNSRFTITQSGNVGINTTNPNAKLSIQQTTGATSALITLLDTNGSTQMVKLGGSSGDVIALGTAVFGSSAGLGGQLNVRLSSGGGIGQIIRAFTNQSGDILQLQDNSAGVLSKFDGSGKLGIGAGSNTLLATADIRTLSATLPVASISGSTNFAGLVVDNSGTGDIFTASKSGASKFVITNAGNVGIGTTTPGFRLDVQDSQSATGAAQIYNTNAGTDADGLVIKLGNTATTTSTTNHWINFEQSGIGVVGSIQGNGSGTINYKTNGTADFAEYMKKDEHEAIPWGSVVCLEEDGLVHVCKNSDTRITGVASEFPTFTGGTDLGNKSITVGLTGVVATTVSSANGAIKPGDLVASSDKPGVAVKASNQQTVVGRAIESYDNNDHTATGKILITIQIGWNGQQTDNAFTPREFNASSAAALGIEDIDAKTATISQTLNVLGRSTFADVGITGRINAGLIMVNGLEGELNTITGPLKIQANGLNGVDLVNGKVVIAATGDVKVEGTLTTGTVRADKYEVDGASDSASTSIGKAIIPAGQTTTEIQTAALTDKSLIFATPDEIPVGVSTKKISKDKFRIKIGSRQTEDIIVNWWIVN